MRQSISHMTSNNDCGENPALIALSDYPDVLRVRERPSSSSRNSNMRRTDLGQVHESSFSNGSGCGSSGGRTRSAVLRPFLNAHEKKELQNVRAARARPAPASYLRNMHSPIL